MHGFELWEEGAVPSVNLWMHKENMQIVCQNALAGI